jgi:hypothetical protein
LRLALVWRASRLFALLVGLRRSGLLCLRHIVPFRFPRIQTHFQRSAQNPV